MEKVIYLAGGCFWGLEHLFSGIPGVIDSSSGYANGNDLTKAKYNIIKAGGTGFKETVKVIYDDNLVSLENLLLAYFYVIHPEEKNRQANDIGTQYQTGIYYTDLESKKIAQKIYDLEKSYKSPFYVEFGELKNFIRAEEYHQDYLVKNPNGYCHISFKAMDIFKKLKIKPEEYTKPAKILVLEYLQKSFE